MYIRGSSPVERAISAAALLLEGKTGDSYIRLYKIEMSKAEAFTADMLLRAYSDPLVYADIADGLNDWLMLYNRTELLKKCYGAELRGKKESVRFYAKDYSYLQSEAPKKAADALYEKALSIGSAAQRHSFLSDETAAALSYLRRAKRYADYSDTRINALGAQLCYAAAESLVQTDTPDTLLKAASYYLQTADWLPDYKDSGEKSTAAKERAVLLYIAAGKELAARQHYAAFRQAKKNFLQAENIIRGSASNELADISKKLTLKLAVVFGGVYSRYPDELNVRRALEQTVAASAAGADTVEVRFIRESGRLSLIFADFDDADLLLIGADDFGTVKEVLGRTETIEIPVAAAVNGGLYNGRIIEQRQQVTVYFQNNFILYDMRAGKKNVVAVFENEAYKTTRLFISRVYRGDVQAKPADFDSGSVYIPGSYSVFFSNFGTENEAYLPLSQSAGVLNETGHLLCRLISSLPYQPHSEEGTY